MPHIQKIRLQGTRTVRQWLTLLVLACILPAASATLLLLYHSYQLERANVERSTIATARALMQAVERELSGAQAALQALATSPYLATDELAAFYRQAQQALRYRPGDHIVLSDASGQQLVNTLRPFGTPLPRHADAAQLPRVFERGQPLLSNLYFGAVAQRPLISIDVPVRRGNQVVYDLSIGFFPERLAEILQRQQLPADWPAAIFDSAGVTVARTHEAGRFVGQKGMPALMQRMQQVSEGAFEADTQEGIPAIVAFSRSSVHGWTVAIGVPRRPLIVELWQSISAVIVGTVLLLLWGWLLARFIGDKIAKSVQGLAEPAMALGYGKPLVLPPLHLNEAADVGQALIKAGALLQARTVELDLAEKAEQDMREIKQQLERSEALQHAIFEQAPIGMSIVSLEGHWRDVNSAMCELVGYSKAELLNRTIQEITHPDDIERDLAYVRQLLNGEIRSYQLEKRYIRKDGSPVTVMLTRSLLRDEQGKPVHFIAQIEDISARQRDQERLAALNNRLALATEAGGIAVWELDLRSQILWWDKRMYALYKVPTGTESVTSEQWWQRIHPDHLERVKREFDAAVSGSGVFSTEFPIVWPASQLRTVRANALLSRDAAGQPLCMTGISWDITESKQKEEAINIALREKETLLKELYHRVKNNLQVICSLFNLQLHTLPEGSAREALREGASRVRAMALVHEKLYQSGNLSSIALDEYIVDLCAQLGNAVGAEQRGMHVAIESDPIQVGLDTAVPLGLLLNELISNSLKHAFPDGRHGTVTVRLHQQADGTVELAVSDNGVGFPVEIGLTSFHSLGLRLVAALSAQLDGKLMLSTDGGACASLVFRLAKRRESGAETGTGLKPAPGAG